MKRLSGDQKAEKPPSVPGSKRGRGESMDRSQMPDPDSPTALKAMVRPSGEMPIQLRNWLGRGVALPSLGASACGGDIVKLTGNGSAGLRITRNAASTIAAKVAAAAISIQSFEGLSGVAMGASGAVS